MTTITGTPVTEACLVSRCGDCFSDDCRHFCHPGADRTCKCGVSIVFMGSPGIGGSWMATDGERPGDFWCPDGSLHKPVCPPSDVKDMIVRWQDVCAGDLVLQGDELVVAEKVSVYQDIWNRETGETFTRADVSWRGGNGFLYCSEHHGDRLTAVRRYVTED